MKKIELANAVGTVLAHDLTEIIPGLSKGARFKKGHVIKEEDLPILLNMGKRHLFVLEKGDDDIHEDEAALRLARAASGSGIALTDPSEGKVELMAKVQGLLKIDKERLQKVTARNEIVLATRHGDRMVKEGDKIAGARVIPLFVKPELIEEAEAICKNKPIIEIRPLQKLNVGVVTTGSEVYHGRIEDAFGPVLIRKFGALGSTVVKQLFADDDETMIAEKIRELIDDGVDMIGVTGGMSVDPDDMTPAGVKKAGGQIVTYGLPVMPGAMFLLAYIGDVPVVGLPGCVMYNRISIFDLIVPRLLAGEKPAPTELRQLAYGGLCLSCPTCSFPNCGFGLS
ncbi:MAG TPA: molybdopterin-binding protein [Clostridiales bacterium]|nr:molybdopterin-binding protein [Clostridiales bacterium]